MPQIPNSAFRSLGFLIQNAREFGESAGWLFLIYMFQKKYQNYLWHFSKADFETRLKCIDGSRQTILQFYGQYFGYRYDICISLKSRKQLQRMCYSNKIIHGPVDRGLGVENLNFYFPGYPTKSLFKIPLANGDFYLRSPFIRIMTVHNKLPLDNDITYASICGG